MESSPTVAQGTQNTPWAPVCPAVASSHLSLAVCMWAAPQLGAEVVPGLPAPGMGAAAGPVHVAVVIVYSFQMKIN